MCYRLHHTCIHVCTRHARAYSRTHSRANTRARAANHTTKQDATHLTMRQLVGLIGGVGDRPLFLAFRHQQHENGGMTGGTGAGIAGDAAGSNPLAPNGVPGGPMAAGSEHDQTSNALEPPPLLQVHTSLPSSSATSLPVSLSFPSLVGCEHCFHRGFVCSPPLHRSCCCVQGEVMFATVEAAMEEVHFMSFSSSIQVHHARRPSSRTYVAHCSRSRSRSRSCSRISCDWMPLYRACVY